MPDSVFRGSAAEKMEKVRVAYVVKMYPRFSETFIVSEVLAHESAGLEIEIFSLRSPVDTHFQDLLARVRSPVHFVEAERPRVVDFWEALSAGSNTLPRFWQTLGAFSGEDPRDVYQGVLLARVLAERQFTHIHAHFGSVAASVARIASRLTGIPYTFTAHAKDIYHESVDPADLRRKLTDAAAVVTVSDFNVAHLRETFGPAAARVRRIYNGVHLSDFRFSPPRDRDNRIVAVGRLVEKKGFDDLVRAVSLLRDRGVSAACEIIGGGEMEAELQRLIAHYHVDDLITLAGPVPQADLMKRVASASVLAAPCVNGADGNRDGLPTVILESMALGTPCVSTPVSGIPEAVRNGETGLLVEERDVEALANAIESLLADTDLRCRLATAARRLIEDDFDVSRNAAAVRTLFRRNRATEAEAA